MCAFVSVPVRVNVFVCCAKCVKSNWKKKKKHRKHRFHCSSKTFYAEWPMLKMPTVHTKIKRDKVRKLFSNCSLAFADNSGSNFLGAQSIWIIHRVHFCFRFCWNSKSICANNCYTIWHIQLSLQHGEWKINWPNKIPKWLNSSYLILNVDSGYVLCASTRFFYFISQYVFCHCYHLHTHHTYVT